MIPGGPSCSCLLKLCVIIGPDRQPLISTGDKVWIAIRENNNFVVRI